MGDPVTAKLTISEPGASADGDFTSNCKTSAAGWGVEWIRVTKGKGETFACPWVGGFLKSAPGFRAVGTADCARPGNY